MIRRTAWYGAWLVQVGILFGPLPAAAQDGGALPVCRVAGAVASLDGLPEASGLAASHRVTGRFWSHNDSGKPILFSLDASGRVTGRVEVSGVKVEDWEAIDAGPCPSGSCLYIGDIGDNEAARRHVTIYRVPEPETTGGTIGVTDRVRARYPDGPHDAETLLVTSKGDIYIVTKGETGPAGVYHLAAGWRDGDTVQLRRVGASKQGGKLAKDDRITDGALSADGRWVALRTGPAVGFHLAADLLAGNWKELRRVPLAALGEPQGEGIAFGADLGVFLVGEGGGKSRPGTFARLACTVS